MLMIGIAGGSGSGKTTFAKKVLQRVSHPSVALLHQDSYYLEKLPQSIHVDGIPNFDHPEAFDWPLFREQLALLKVGKSVQVPLYDYKACTRLPQTETVGPCKVVLVEGIFTLWDAEIRDLFDAKFFLHVDADIRFIRRLHRDVRERGRTLDGIIRQYYDTVRPMHREFLEPTASYADIVVGEETDIAADLLAAKVVEHLREHYNERIRS